MLPAYQSQLEKNQFGDKDKPSPAKFFAARILWDEAMASRAVRHLEDNPGDLVVVCTAADHVKFGLGAPFRVERLLKALEIKTPGRGQSMGRSGRWQSMGTRGCVTLLIDGACYPLSSLMNRQGQVPVAQPDTRGHGVLYQEVEAGPQLVRYFGPM